MALNNLTIVHGYYMNPGMLNLQLATMADYHADIKAKLEYIVVDDGSPLGFRAEEAIPQSCNPGFDFWLYRILTDLRWNQDGARNLGAHHASSQWLLLTDIDHLLQPEHASQLFRQKLDPRVVYTFTRRNVADGSVKPPHPNSYLMTQDMYWEIGGYDELFCGHYGTDGLFKGRVQQHAEVRCLKVPLTLVGRSDLPDASTTTLTRKDPEDKQLMWDIRQFTTQFNVPVQTLRMPWKQIR